MVDIEPKKEDLQTVLKWYSLVFTSKKRPNEQDEKTHRRMLAMYEAIIDEEASEKENSL